MKTKTAQAALAPMEKSKLRQLLRNVKKQRELWLLCVPIIAWVVLFAYVPMFGIFMAFFDYIPGMALLDCTFVGFKHFVDFLTDPIFFQLMRNTLAMSLLSITVGFVAPIVLALLVNELGSKRFKKVVQTTSYLPYFVSWVVAGNMIFMILSSEGMLNDVLMALHLIQQPIAFLSTGEYYWTIFTCANIWKGVGWSAIIYLSAISGVDSELYEAGAIDGMGRLGLVKHIIIPTILPTIVLLWILGIGGILNAGFDQHLVLGNATTQNYWDVIDTYSYRYGIQLGNYSPGVAISLMKSLIGIILVGLTNYISKKKLDTAIF
ncbi:MAG: ABC transporter permease subunit [Angelakisella sp.]